MPSVMKIFSKTQTLHHWRLKKKKILQQFYKVKQAIWRKKKTSESENVSKRRNSKFSINTVKIIAIYIEFRILLEESTFFKTHRNQRKPARKLIRTIDFFFLLCPYLPSVFLLHLKLSLLLCLLQRTLGKFSHRRFSLWTAWVADSDWSSFGKKQNWHFGCSLCYHLPRHSKGIKILQSQTLYGR